MTWQLTADVSEFAERAGEFLRSRPVQHTVLLTVVGTLQQRGLHAYGSEDPIFGWWRAGDGAVAGALMQTPPHPLIFTTLPPEAVPAAVQALAGRPLAAVNLMAADADAFVTPWRQSAGVEAKVAMRTRLFRLERLTVPDPMPAGVARRAAEPDRALVLEWFRAFHDELGMSGDSKNQADERLAAGGVSLWEVDGAPVSMAVRTGTAAGMARIQYVYTPPSARRRGFAGAVTTVATQAALDDGAAEVVLYTDLANPTTNALYPRLGYRPIEDRTVVEFSS